MQEVLVLAQKGWGRTNPNPLVGAVIVKEGQIVGTGYHAFLGGEHAEPAAIRAAGRKCLGATLYVNLEPCSHYGKTPPCSTAIIESGISKVVVAMVDPNPLVSGRGIRQLEEAGLEVEVGLMAEEARKLNEIFIKYITKKRPF